MRRLATIFLVCAASAVLALPAGASSDPLFGQQWGLAKIGAPRAWSVADGDGVVIAIVDSGVDLRHSDLKAKIVPGTNFVEPGTPPQDDCGHGTHVAGIAAASTGNGIGVAGVAPGAKIMPVRVLAADGSGECSGGDPSPAIRWAADHGARVINLSLGEDTQSVFGPSFADAISYAWSKGAICVVAAGNQFVLSSGFGNEPALVVTATDRNDGKPMYSSGVGDARWGLAAPGGAGNVIGSSDSTVDILSTYYDTSQPNNHNDYATLAGTSMAAPFVSGAAAVLLSMGLSKEQVVQRLLATADDIGSPATFGHGRLDLDRAVHAVAGTSPARSGPRIATPGVPSTPSGPQPPRRSSATPPATASVTRLGSPRPTAGASVSYAAPRNSTTGRRGFPLAAVAAGVLGAAAVSAGGAALVRLRHTRQPFA
jgi:subtilisin family serine protease